MATLNTKLVSVKVYRNGAEITREGTVSLSAGTQLLEVCGISSNAALDTVRLYAPEGVVCANQHFADPSDRPEDKP